MCEAVIGAAQHSEDPSWVEGLCMDLARGTSEVEVRAAALLGLAHIARRFGRLDDLPGIQSLLAQLDADPDLAGRAQDVRDDLQIFLDR